MPITAKKDKKEWGVPLRSGARREQRGQEQWVRSCCGKPHLLLINTVGWGGRGGGSSGGKKNPTTAKEKQKAAKIERLGGEAGKQMSDCICKFCHKVLRKMKSNLCGGHFYKSKICTDITLKFKPTICHVIIFIITTALYFLILISWEIQVLFFQSAELT